jgi:hypothetical protein
MLAIRYVDFYYPSGKKYRKIFSIETKTDQATGEVFCTQLREVGLGGTIIASFPSTFPGDALKTLKGRLKDLLLATKKENPDWLVDNSRDWMKVPSNFYPLIIHNEIQYPSRYDTWDGKTWKKSSEGLQNKLHRLATNRPTVSRPPLPVDLHPQAAPVERLPFDGEYTCIRCEKKTNDWSTRFDSKTCLCQDCSNKDTGQAEKQNVGNR